MSTARFLQWMAVGWDVRLYEDHRQRLNLEAWRNAGARGGNLLSDAGGRDDQSPAGRRSDASATRRLRVDSR
jgi:hypothetical protein